MRFLQEILWRQFYGKFLRKLVQELFRHFIQAFVTFFYSKLFNQFFTVVPEKLNQKFIYLWSPIELVWEFLRHFDRKFFMKLHVRFLRRSHNFFFLEIPKKITELHLGNLAISSEILSTVCIQFPSELIRNFFRNSMQFLRRILSILSALFYEKTLVNVRRNLLEIFVEVYHKISQVIMTAISSALFDRYLGLVPKQSTWTYPFE